MENDNRNAQNTIRPSDKLSIEKIIEKRTKNKRLLIYSLSIPISLIFFMHFNSQWTRYALTGDWSDVEFCTTMMRFFMFTILLSIIFSLIATYQIYKLKKK
jgi:hypothetical protein